MAAAVTALVAEQTDGDSLRGRIAELESDIVRLEYELLSVRARAGELKPPVSIATTSDARVWLEWARRNHHTAGCCCNRCPEARRLLAD